MLCSAVISKKKSIVTTHYHYHHTSPQGGYACLGTADEMGEQLMLVKSFKSYRKCHGSGLGGTGLRAAVPDEEAVRRIQTIITFLQAGIPLL